MPTAIDKEQNKAMGTEYIIGAAFSVALIGTLVLLVGVHHEQNKKNRNLRSSQILQPVELASQLL